MAKPYKVAFPGPAVFIKNRSPCLGHKAGAKQNKGADLPKGISEVRRIKTNTAPAAVEPYSQAVAGTKASER